MPNVFQSIFRYQKLLFVVAAGVLLAGWLMPTTRAQFRRMLRMSDATYPSLAAEACVYDAETQRLTLRGLNFHPEAQVTLLAPNGVLSYRTAQVIDETNILVEGVEMLAASEAVTVTVTNPVEQQHAVRAPSATIVLAMSVPLRRRSSSTVSDIVRAFAPDQAGALNVAEVQQIIAQAVAQADASNLKVTIAVVDAEGNPLGVFAMNGAGATTRVGNGTGCTPTGCANTSFPLRCGLEGVCVPSCAAALAKAVTGSFLSSQGHAFSTRTASFIVQEHFPPGVNFQPSGPLFGVQFSQLLCSDVNPRSALGLSADPGGLPLYKNGVKVGGVGIEGDGRYTTAEQIAVPTEEVIALAATRGFEAPTGITGDKIIVNGIRFPYVKAEMPAARTVQSFNLLAGTINPCLGLAPVATQAALPSDFIPATLGDAPAGRINKKLFPAGAASFGSSADLSQAEVVKLLTQAAKQAFITRAAIRQPLNSAAEVNVTICDADGKILGIFSTQDAPIFGLDVSAQKARTAAFYSHPDAANRLRNAGYSASVTAAEQDNLRLSGAIAYSDRAVGFLARPYYPDGIDGTPPGPFSVPIANFSPFNVGLQSNILAQAYVENLLRFIDNGDVVAGTDALTKPCPNAVLTSLANGLQIFPGSVPIYKNGKVVGAIGVSGDGVDQDDLVAAMGSAGLETPENIRTSTVMARGTRLPWVKFPRNPTRD